MPHRTRRLTSRCVVLLAAATLTLGPPSAAHASVVGALGILDDTANGGINPNTGAPWAPGDTYRFVFITSSDHTAVSPLIESYNQQVQLIADLSPLGIGMSEGVSWTVVGSTDQVDARDNTQANPSRQGGGMPILLLDGRTVVAQDYVDLWDGELDHAIDLDENGATRTGWPFTGSYSDGTRASDHASSFGALGATGNVGQGQSADPALWCWRTWTGDPPTTSHPLYAMSDILTIPLLDPDDPIDTGIDATSDTGTAADPSDTGGTPDTGPTLDVDDPTEPTLDTAPSVDGPTDTDTGSPTDGTLPAENGTSNTLQGSATTGCRCDPSLAPTRVYGFLPWSRRRAH